MSFPLVINPDFTNSPFNPLGRKLSAFKKFDDIHYDNVNITSVYVGLRKIGESNFFQMF